MVWRPAFATIRRVTEKPRTDEPTPEVPRVRLVHSASHDDDERDKFLRRVSCVCRVHPSCRSVIQPFSQSVSHSVSHHNGPGNNNTRIHSLGLCQPIPSTTHSTARRTDSTIRTDEAVRLLRPSRARKCAFPPDVGRAHVLGLRVGPGDAAHLGVRRGERERAVEGYVVGDVAVPGECDVCVHVALFLQRDGAGVSGGAAGVSDGRRELYVLDRGVPSVCA